MGLGRYCLAKSPKTRSLFVVDEFKRQSPVIAKTSLGYA